MLALILRGFRLVPAEARASVFKDAVSAWRASPEEEAFYDQ